MPKERLHLLLADESLRLLREPNLCGARDREAYLLGAVCPDVFFYDVPSFKLGRVGRELHRFEGEAAFSFIAAWLREEKGRLEAGAASWLLGFASHLLADGLLHPLINDFCGRFSGGLDLTPKSCHHWLESELESHWLGVIGPADGYLPLLERLPRRGGTETQSLACFRKFLVRAGVSEVPPETEIHRCLAWQTALLRLFASPVWSGIRPRLLKRRWSEPLGVLLVPPKSSLCLASDSRFSVLCQPEFMARTVFCLASRLRELAEHF